MKHFFHVTVGDMLRDNSELILGHYSIFTKFREKFKPMFASDSVIEEVKELGKSIFEEEVGEVDTGSNSADGSMEIVPFQVVQQRKMEKYRLSFEIRDVRVEKLFHLECFGDTSLSSRNRAAFLKVITRGAKF